MSESLPSPDAAAPFTSGLSLLTRARAKGDHHPEPREAITAGAQLLVFVLGLAALASAVGASSLAHEPRSWLTFVLLAAAAVTAQLFGVHSTRNQSYHLAIVFVVAGAMLLPPELIALLCIVQHIPEWLKERYPLEIQAFNIANYTLAALAAFAGAQVVLGPENAGADSRTALAGLVAGGAFVLVNHGLLAGMLRVARGHSLRQSGLFAVESLSTDLVLAAIGIGLAAWWHENLWFVPVAIAPLVLIHRALSIPSLRAAASLDTKTGLYNAGHLNSALADEMERAVRFDRPLSVIVADLDLLRRINNSHGHLSGDAVLRGVADVLRTQLRPYDVAARFGGEEFAVVLPETEFEEALAIAERVRMAVGEQPFHNRAASEPVPATLSLGVASYPLHARDCDELVHQADLALYRAKALGRNRVCGATAETRLLNKLIQGAGRAEQATGDAQPRGFRPYGPRRRLEDGPTTLDRLRVAAQSLGARGRTILADVRPERGASRAEQTGGVIMAAPLVAAGSLLALNALHVEHIVRSDPLGFAGFAFFALSLQLLCAGLYGNGAEGAAAIAIVGAGISFGPAAAVAIAVLAALGKWVVRKRVLAPSHAAFFEIANYALSAAAGAYGYQAVAEANGSALVRFLAAVVAVVAFRGVNSALLGIVTGVAGRLPFRTGWERLRWASAHKLVYASLAFATALAYHETGLTGLAAFAVPPAILAMSVRRYVRHTRASVEGVLRANEELRRSNADLAESSRLLRKAHLARIAALYRSMEAKDHDTGSHTERVAAVAVAVAYKLGYRGDELEAIEIGALLQDIGKIGIPESVLHKRGPLSDDEWKLMREHPVISDYILSGVDLHPFVRQIARSSHERIDGQGYPDGLAGNEIPLPSRITLVADAFDALTSNRPYRIGRSIAAALAELRAHAGTQFCPLVVEALEALAQEAPQVLARRTLHAVGEVA